MKVAITGGRGRLAPLMAKRLSAVGCDVSLFSRRGGDGFLPLTELPACMEDYDAVIHSAWSSVPLTAERDPECTRRDDLPLLERLLSGTGRTQFIFLSTAAVYGNTGADAADETVLPNPLGAYAWGKLQAEALVLHSGAPASVLRISNLLGERFDPQRPQGILPCLIHSARTGDPVTIWGDGTATKDYLHCEDFSSALACVLSKKIRGVFNLCLGQSVSLLELIHLVEGAVGRPVVATHAEHFSWDVSHSLLTHRKLSDATGWVPSLSVADAVRECVARF